MLVVNMLPKNGLVLLFVVAVTVVSVGGYFFPVLDIFVVVFFPYLTASP